MKREGEGPPCLVTITCVRMLSLSAMGMPSEPRMRLRASRSRLVSLARTFRIDGDNAVQLVFIHADAA